MKQARPRKRGTECSPSYVECGKANLTDVESRMVTIGAEKSVVPFHSEECRDHNYSVFPWLE